MSSKKHVNLLSLYSPKLAVIQYTVMIHFLKYLNVNVTWKVITEQLNAISSEIAFGQGGITCGAIEDPRKSSKAIDERVIINFRDKNGVIARFRDKNVVIVRFCDKNVECLYIYYGVIEE